jgi:D-alanyl-D-alanine carboxypeptidase/D-alanyl-D-alanine-endopeptidase (penicillin-binding protein 4)
VVDGSGKILYARNAETRFVPASNQKLVSVLFAFDTLGAEYRCQTRIWKGRGRVDVESSGDPSLTLDDLRSARKKLKLFDGWPVHVHGPYKSGLGPGWEWDDLPWYYAAQTSPLTVDRAEFDVWASRGRLEPLDPEFRVKIVRRHNGKAKTEFDPNSNTLTVTGPLPKSRERLGRFAQPAPMQVAAHALGGDATTDTGPVPVRPPDFIVEGKPLAQSAKFCLEESDNMIAERLLTLAALKVGPIADTPYPTAPQTARSYLTLATGTLEEWFRPVDGSGLSRHNQIAPRALCQLLNWALTRPYAQAWLESLPAPGEGTMKNRLKDSTFIGKTGTMDAVVSLSGYVTTSAGARLTFSCLVNNNLAPASEVRTVQDRFVRALENGLKVDDTLSKAP